MHETSYYLNVVINKVYFLNLTTKRVNTLVITCFFKIKLFSLEILKNTRIKKVHIRTKLFKRLKFLLSF